MSVSDSTPERESLHALSGAYVVDALDDTERAAFEAHLPHCADCQAEVAGLREATALMAHEAATTPPASLRTAVLAGISEIRPLPPEVAQSATSAQSDVGTVVPLRRRFRLASLAAAAAVLVAVGTGVAIDQPWRHDTTSSSSEADRVLASADVQKVALDLPDGSSATVYRSRSEGRAVLLTRDMPAPPDGKTYELWLQDATGHMSPAGLMRKAGVNKVLLRGDASAATGVGITVEPTGGSTQPTTQPIALFDFGKAEA